MHSSTRLALFVGLRLGAVATLSACEGDDDATPVPSVDASTQDAGATGFVDNGVLELQFKPMYSAYVEGHEATLPVTFRYPPFRQKGATFSSSDPTIATVLDTPEGALISVKRAGTVVIRAALEGDTGSAKLTIKGFTEAQWKIGEARYLRREPAVVAPDGGVVSVLRLAEPNARNPSGSCLTCHSADATLLKVEDTPAQTAGYSDQELITIFTMGALPSWVEKATQPVQFIWGANHAWTVTEEEQQGLLAYLRTKAPKAVPPRVQIGTRPCTVVDGQPVLCDAQGKPIVLPTRDGGTDAGATGVDAGVRGGLDAGMAGDAFFAGD